MNIYKKTGLVIISIVIISLSFLIPVSAATQVSPVFSEPPYSENVSYLFLADKNSNDLHRAFLIVVSLLNNIEIANSTNQVYVDDSLYWSLQDDGISLRWIPDTTENYSILGYVTIYRAEGTFLRQYPIWWYSTQTDPTYLELPAFNEFYAYWIKGDIGVLLVDDVYVPANILWADDKTIMTAITQANNFISTANSLLGAVNVSLNQLKTIDTDTYNLLTDFEYVFQSYVNNDQAAIRRLQNRLDTIIELLQGTAEQPTVAYPASPQQNVDNYQQAEQGFMDTLNNNSSSFDSIFDNLDNLTPTFNNGFLFIKNIFDNFITGFGVPQIVLIFSLTFGLILLIIGRRMG